MTHAARSRSAALISAVMLCACGDEAPLPATTLHIEVTPTQRSVVFGEAFDLRLILRSAADLQTDPFDWRQFDPLVIEEVARSTRRDAETKEEIIELRARAFHLDRVTLEPLRWRAASAAAGDHERLVAHSEPLEFEVLSALQPKHGVEPELPFAPRAPNRFWLWMLAIAGLSSIALLWYRMGRGRRLAIAPLAPAAEPPIDATNQLLLELDALREQTAHAERDRGAAALFAGEIARILRSALSARVDLLAHVQTRAEIARDPRWQARASEREREVLNRMLMQCERTQFARAGLADGAALRLLIEARSFVLAEEPA